MSNEQTPQVNQEAAPEANVENTENQVAETTEENKDAVAAKAPEVPAKKEEPKSSKKKYKIQVDKREEELEFDPSNEQEVIKHLQMSRAAQKRMNESAELRKIALNFIEELKKDPRKVLSDPSIGVDVKKFAQDILNEEIKELEKSPEQREKDKLIKELQDLKNKAKLDEENRKKTDFEKLQAEQERFLETEISAALDVGGLPKTAGTVAKMAQMMYIAMQNDIDLSPKDVIGLVKNNTMSDFKEVVAALSDDQLEDFLGKEVLGRLRKKNIAKAKTATSTINQVKSTGQQKPKEPETASKKQTYKEFFGA